MRKFNRHWVLGFKYPYPVKRGIFKELKESISSRFIVQIIGLRRTGKTVLMLQLINSLIEDGVDPLKILYFTFDEEITKLDDLLNEFDKITDLRKNKVYVFLDEIQKLPNFESQIKIYYDIYPNIKFFISGSTSLFLKKKSRESLVGRVKSFFVGPLTFKEYLIFLRKDYILDNPTAFFPDIRKEFEKYIFSQFIEAIFINSVEEKKEYYKSILKKITFEDIPLIFPVDYPELLHRIVKIVGSRPGILVDYKSLANDLNISNKTLSSYIQYLTESFLVRKVYNFSPNLLTSEKKLKKFYLASPSLSWAVGDTLDMGSLVENTVLSVKNFKYFWRDAYKHEVDFVDVKEEEKKIIPVEVKYKDNIKPADLKGLKSFAKKFGISKGVILAKMREVEIIHLDGLEIVVKPVFFELK